MLNIRFVSVSLTAVRIFFFNLLQSGYRCFDGICHSVDLKLTAQVKSSYHCIERITARYGPGRRPTTRQIEKDGYRWARLGLLDLESANRYLMQYAGRKSQMGQYMRVLQLGDRAPSPSEERYLLGWAEMGFPPETVELAYDRTILKCRELRWNYLNKILKNWYEKGLRTPEEVAAGDRRRPSLPRKEERAAGSNVERMKKYLEDSRR